MGPSAANIAREYLLGHLRLAREPGAEHGPGDVWQTDSGNWRSQNPQGVPQSFGTKPQADAWAKGYDPAQSQEQPQKGQKPEPSTDEGTKKYKQGPHSEVALKTLDIARNGTEISKDVLSGGGAGKSTEERAELAGQNQSFIVELEHNNKREKFVFKPAEGEEEGLSLSVPGGTYHQREQAAYGLDSLVGGRTIVPPTITKGDKSGSFQSFQEGARGINSFEDMNAVVDKVPFEDLVQNPDFERLNVMDLMMGHEDRHRGNIMVRFDGEEKPENLRLVAIDNGIAMGGKLPEAKSYGYRNPFLQWTSVKGFGSQDTGEAEAPPSEGTVKLDKTAPIPQGTRKLDEGTAKIDDMPSAKEIERAYNELEENAKDKGLKAVRETLGNISPDLHKQIKDVKLPDVAKSMADAGMRDPGAVRGQMVRMAAMQADPKIFSKVLADNDNDLEKSWRAFQHMSHGDELLKLAGAEDKAAEIDKAMDSQAPEGGWDPPEKAEKRVSDYIKKMEEQQAKLDDWGASPRPEAQRAPGAPQRTAPIHEDPEATKDDGKGMEFDQWGTRKLGRQGVLDPKRVMEQWLRRQLRTTS